MRQVEKEKLDILAKKFGYRDCEHLEDCVDLYGDPLTEWWRIIKSISLCDDLSKKYFPDGVHIYSSEEIELLKEECYQDGVDDGSYEQLNLYR